MIEYFFIVISIALFFLETLPELNGCYEKHCSRKILFPTKKLEIKANVQFNLINLFSTNLPKTLLTKRGSRFLRHF